MCFFCKCWGSPPKKILESRVMTYDSNIGCFLFLFLPKYMSMFNSINLIHPRSYLLNGGTWFFLGGMEIPTKFKQALTKSLNPVSRVFTQQVHRMFQMFACHFFRCPFNTFCFHPLFHQPLGVSGRSLGRSLKMKWRIGDGPMEVSKRSSNI